MFYGNEIFSCRMRGELRSTFAHIAVAVDLMREIASALAPRCESIAIRIVDDGRLEDALLSCGLLARLRRV